MDAKVDIRRLQFLNDRIAQVTDALNQVRLSVHGLQQQPQLGFPQQSPYGVGPMGVQHSPYSSIPGMNPFGQQSLWQGGSQSPMGGGLGQQYAAYGPQTQPSWFPFLGGGLYHSPTELIEQRLGEQRANDPNRILQTFPLCLAPISTTPW